jgi:hypothetical protein
MTGPRRLALQGWIVIGLLVLILLGIVGLGVEIKALPYLWRGDAPSGDLERGWRNSRRPPAVSRTSLLGFQIPR